MATPRRFLSRTMLRRAAIAGVLAAALGLAAVLFPSTGGRLANLSYDALFLLQPRRAPAPGPAVIVRMDDRSTQELGQGEAERWDRRIFAQVLDRLREAGCEVVAFDIRFGIESPDQDPLLLAAVQRHGRVAVAAGRDFRQGVVSALLPFEELRAHAAIGMAEHSGADQVFRRPWADPRLKLPSLPVAAARLAGVTNEPPSGAWLRFYGPAETLPSVPIMDVHAGRATNFAGRVAFIGKDRRLPFFSDRDSDFHFTPHSRWTGERMPGVEIVATAYLNTVRGEWIHDLGPWRTIGWIAGLGFLLGGILRLLRPKPALLLAVAGAVGVAAAAVHFGWRHGVTWPWAALVLVQIPAALVWSVVSHYHEMVPTRATTPPAPVPDAAASGSELHDAPTLRSPASPLPASAPTPTGRPEVPNYEMISCVGRGGYGEVWLARDLVGSCLAVKLIFRRSFEDERPYQREFRGMSMFSPVSRQHPGLVHVLHIGRNEAAGYFYYVMEPADDERLGAEIEPRSYLPRTLQGDLRRRGRYAPPEAVQLGLALGEALAFLHGLRLIHRDIKPANILFVRGQPKLADIGLVTRLAERPEDTTYLGTRGFIAPEGPGTASADVYGLAKVIFVAVSGGQAGDFPPPAGKPPAPPADPALAVLLGVLGRACSENPAERYQTAGEFVAALRAVAG
ncbi:MAG: serine/threonine-protein kinase [Limisphaerales bacterium]